MGSCDNILIKHVADIVSCEFVPCKDFTSFNVCLKIVLQKKLQLSLNRALDKRGIEDHLKIIVLISQQKHKL